MANNCGCKSYNWDGVANKATIITASYKKAYVDDCIAETLQKLNNAGFETVASCCGHHTANPSVAFSSRTNLNKAVKYLLKISQYDRWLILVCKSDTGGSDE